MGKIPPEIAAELVPAAVLHTTYEDRKIVQVSKISAVILIVVNH